MAFDFDVIQRFYQRLAERVSAAREAVGRPLTYAEKVLYAHLWSSDRPRPFKRGDAYVNFGPDRVAMQDATAQMALLQFMQAGKSRVAVPATVHADHLIPAKNGAGLDLAAALDMNREVYAFLASASSAYGIGFWKPGAGIIHPVSYTHLTLPTKRIV